MTPTTPTTNHREAILQAIIASPSFKTREIAARAGVPEGTVSALVSHLRAAGALTVTRVRDGQGSTWQHTGRMPKTLSGAKRAAKRGRADSAIAPRARRAKLTRPSPKSGSSLVELIKTWQQKAGVLDRLVADLGLSDADLRPYLEA